MFQNLRLVLKFSSILADGIPFVQSCLNDPWLRMICVTFSGIARSEPDGTRRRTGGEVKGKDANGVGSQQPCIVGPKALLPTIKTSD